MKIKNISDILFHTLEIGGEQWDDDLRMGFDIEPVMMEEWHIGEVESFFRSMAGMGKNKLGHVGLSTSILSKKIPMKTFNLWSLNCGIMLDRKSPHLKTLIASPYDLGTVIEEKNGKRKIHILVDPLGAPPGFMDELQKAGAKIETVDNGFLQRCSFNENKLLANPVKYSVGMAAACIDSYDSFAEYKKYNHGCGWSEVIVAAKIDAVKGVFFSSEFRGIENMDKKYKDYFARDSQMMNALFTAAVLNRLKDHAKYLPVVEYDADNGALKKINVAQEKQRLLNKYDSYISNNLKGLLLSLPDKAPAKVATR